ncbi:hypothetical protein G6F46_014250 [Rhizopus delemar]|nr:hypothetical protein G6F46_014250 [Rhizopus delemar]
MAHRPSPQSPRPGSAGRAPRPTARWSLPAAALRAVAGAARQVRQPSAQAGLERVEQGAGNVQAVLGIQLAHAGRAGHVDFGQVIANHVQADEAHATALHLRADLGGDPAVALAQRTAVATAAGGQ